MTFPEDRRGQATLENKVDQVDSIADIDGFTTVDITAIIRRHRHQSYWVYYGNLHEGGPGLLWLND